MPVGLLGNEVKESSRPGSGHCPSRAQIKPLGGYWAILGSWEQVQERAGRGAVFKGPRRAGGPHCPSPGIIGR